MALIYRTRDGEFTSCAMHLLYTLSFGVTFCNSLCAQDMQFLILQSEALDAIFCTRVIAVAFFLV
jgi:hypothetical protein